MEEKLARAEQLGYDYLKSCKTQACSQAVLMAVQDVVGPRDDLLIKAAGPMAGGSRIGSLCGALQGGILALGMKYGPSGEEMRDLDKLLNSFEKAQKLYRFFEKEFDSRLCHEVIGGDLNDRFPETLGRLAAGMIVVVWLVRQLAL